MISKELKNKNFLLPLLAVMFLNISLFIILNTPSAQGYEISIFDVFPIYLWIFIAVTIIISIFTLLNNDLDVRTRKITLLLFLLTDFLILCLPLIRGYFFYGRGDVLTHLSYITDIMVSGKISIDNFYPISHIFETIFIQISGINPKLAIMGTPALFFLIYMSGTYLLTKFITKNLDKILFLFAFSGILLYSYFGSMFLPNSLSFTFLPLILYVLAISFNDNYSNVSYSVLLIILLFLTAFFHPLNSINLIIMFIIVLFSILVVKWRDTSGAKNLNPSRVINMILILGVTFVIWFTSYAVFQRSFKKVYDWLVYNVGTTPIASYHESVFSSNWSNFEILRNVFLSYGNEIIFILISGFVLILIIKNMKKFNININYKLFKIFLPLNFIVFLLMSGVLLTGSFGLTNPQRELIYVLFFSMLLNGLFLYDWINKKGGKKYLKIIIFTLFLSLAALTGIYSTYSSLAMGTTNFQVTESELVGSNFLFEHVNPNVIIYSLNNEVTRYSDVINGVRFTEKVRYKYFLDPPKDLNFKNGSNNQYMVLNEYSLQRYSTYLKNDPNYSKKDLDSLQNNSLLSKFYDNGDMRLWIIQ